MYPAQAPLPVDPVQINSTNVFHSPGPQNLPFAPQVMAPPHVFPFVPVIAGHLIGAIQSNAMKNPIRTFTFNFLSQNRYNNDWFNRLLADTVSYFELALTFVQQNGRPQDPNQLAVQVATEYAVIASALLVSQFPALVGYQTPEMSRDMQNTLNMHQSIQTKIQQMRAQQGTNYQYPSPQSVGTPPGWSPEDALRGPDGMTPFERIVKGGQTIEMHPSFGNREMRPGELGQQLFREGGGDSSGFTTEASGGGLSPRPVGPIRQLQSLDEPVMITGSELSFDNPIPEVRSITMPASEVAEPVALQPDPQHVVHVHVTEEEYQDRKRQLEATVTGEFGSNYIKAGGDTKITTDIRMVYDPTLYVPYYHELSDGTVSVVLVNRTEENMGWDYKEHELDMQQIGDQARPDAPNTPKLGITAEGIENLKRTERELAELHLAQEREREELAIYQEAVADNPDLDIEPVVQSKTCVLYSHSHREALNLSLFGRRAGSDSKRLVREFFYRVVKPVTLNDPESTVRQIRELSANEASYDQLFLRLGTYMEGHEDAGVWKELNKRITKTLDRALNTELGCVDCHFDSFADDYADLMESLGKLYSQNHLDTIESTAPEYIKQAFTLLNDEQIQEYVNALIHLGSDITDETADRLAVLSEYCAVAELPIPPGDLEPFLTTNILPTQAKVFHTLIRGLVENANKLSPNEKPKVFLRLLDESMYEVHTSKMVEDVYILRPINLA